MKVILHNGKATVPSKDFIGKEDELAAKLGITNYTLVDEAPINPQEEILRQIYILEAQITRRREREAILTTEGKTWLQNIEAQIETLRNQL
jgi:hypothetical protein